MSTVITSPTLHAIPGEPVTYTVAAVHYRGEKCLALSVIEDDKGQRMIGILPLSSVVLVPLPCDELSFVVLEK